MCLDSGREPEHLEGAHTDTAEHTNSTQETNRCTTMLPYSSTTTEEDFNTLLINVVEEKKGERKYRLSEIYCIQASSCV